MTFDYQLGMDTPEPIDWQTELERLLHTTHDADSHVEHDPAVFHPSQLARCKRQATISKLGLDDHDTETLGLFRAGTLIHGWLERCLAGTTHGVHHEHPIEADYHDPDGRGGITVTGRADVYDEHDGVVYDFKTRGGWYNFDPPRDRHVRQLTLYMDALDVTAGQLVYVNKKNFEIRTWPPEGSIGLDPELVEAMIRDAREIRDAIEEHLPILDVAAVPFEQCGCWLCDEEGSA